MGVVQRQGFYGLLINLMGIGVGAMAMGFVYKDDLNAYGLVQIILQTAILLAPLASLGVNVLVTRYFVHYRSDAGARAAFLSTLLLVATVGGAAVASLYLTAGVSLLRYIDTDANNWEIYVNLSLPIVTLVVLQCYTTLLEAYVANLRKVTVTQFLVNLLPKLVLPGLFLLRIYRGWSLPELVMGVVAMKVVVVGGLVMYLLYLGEFRLTYRLGPILRGAHFREMISVAGFSLFGVLGGVLIGRLDTVSLGGYVTKTQVGVYNYAIFAAMVISLPYAVLLKLASPQIAEYVARAEWNLVQELYGQVARIMSFCGAFIMAGVLVNVEELLRLTGKYETFAGVLFAFVFLGLSRMTDLTGSLNGQIMGYSRLYRQAFYFVVAAGGLNLFFNYLFIAELRYGLAGAGAATFLALLAFNFTKSAYVYHHFRVHPLSWAVLRNYGLLGLIGTVGYLWSPPGSLLLIITVKSLAVTAVFAAYAWFSPDQPEIRGAVVHQLRRFGFGR